MEENLQTHTIPPDRRAQERLARLMGFTTLDEFKTAHQAHTRNVRLVFDRMLRADAGESQSPSPFPRQFEGAESAWKKLLAEHAFKDVEKAFRVLREFVEGRECPRVAAHERTGAPIVTAALCSLPAAEAGAIGAGG